MRAALIVASLMAVVAIVGAVVTVILTRQATATTASVATATRTSASAALAHTEDIIDKATLASTRSATTQSLIGWKMDTSESFPTLKLEVPGNSDAPVMRVFLPDHTAMDTGGFSTPFFSVSQGTHGDMVFGMAGDEFANLHLRYHTGYKTKDPYFEQAGSDIAAGAYVNYNS
jgi:type II secretory pathway pseudopilin PulG